MATKMASRKKNSPSIAKGIPKAAPNRPISPGQSSPSSNESTVPDTAPTAKSTAATCDQRRASASASSSPRRRPRQLAMSIRNVKATPKGTRMMWNPRVKAICSRAGSSCDGSPAAASSAPPSGGNGNGTYPACSGPTGGAPPVPCVAAVRSGQEGLVRAMTYRGPYKIRVEEKDRPAIEHPNDAIVRVTLAAICGSDLHLYHGLMPDTRVGHTFGHEFIGVVDEVGSSVQNLQVGDRVMVPFNIFCGSCWFCARGLYSNCHNVNPNATAVGGIYGYSHTTGGYDGGQSQYVRVPFADVGPTLIPDWMSDEDAVLLTDAVPTGYFGAQLGDIAEGDTVVVFGAGRVGLVAAQSAWLMGAGRVIVIDHLDYRLEKARTFAHAETLNFTEYDDVVVELKKQTDFLGADVAIDCVGAEADGNFLQHVTSSKLKLQGGSPVALNWAIDSVRKGATISVMGAFGPLFSAIKFGDAMNKGLTFHTNQCPVKRQWPRLFEHVRNGYLRPSELATHRVPLEDIAEGYHIFSAKLDDCIKPVIDVAA